MKEKDFIHRSYNATCSAIYSLGFIFDNISLPIRNSFYYDIIVEKDFNLFRVKVIYTNAKQPNGNYIASIRKSGGYYAKKEQKVLFDPKFCEYLFIETPESKYLIPANKILTKRSITLNKYNEFKLAS